jgi:hypothetical protein
MNYAIKKILSSNKLLQVIYLTHSTVQTKIFPAVACVYFGPGRLRGLRRGKIGKTARVRTERNTAKKVRRKERTIAVRIEKNQSRN